MSLLQCRHHIFPSCLGSISMFGSYPNSSYWLILFSVLHWTSLFTVFECYPPPSPVTIQVFYLFFLCTLLVLPSLTQIRSLGFSRGCLPAKKHELTLKLFPPEKCIESVTCWKSSESLPAQLS